MKGVYLHETYLYSDSGGDYPRPFSFWRKLFARMREVGAYDRDYVDLLKLG